MLQAADNTARASSCASRCWAARKRRYAGVGDVIKVSIKDAIPRGKVKKGEVYDAVVVRTKSGVRRAGRLADPLRRQRGGAADHKLEPIGTRIFGPVTRELRSDAVHEDHLARAGSALSGD